MSLHEKTGVDRPRLFPGEDRTYLAIDLKSFYASVECAERGLDPMEARLVVADESRTDKTIVLAVSPALKAYGIPGRPRLFEVRQTLEAHRRRTGETVDFLIAPPRMSMYMRYSTMIYDIYLRYVSPEDVHVYSVDEVFIDLTAYLRTYQKNAHDMAMMMIRDVLFETGITATAGIGTNLYLAKIAMDIVAKRAEPDEDGVRIASLTERSYRERLWDHEPITDFWRIGRGYERRLAEQGMFTMGDVARCSIGDPKGYHNEALLYRMFGVNAELLIDHAWGYEPCLMEDIKRYVPEERSISQGQVLTGPYTFDKGRIIVREMAELLAVDLRRKGIVTDHITLTVGYDIENMKNEAIRRKYQEDLSRDHYGRMLPRGAHGSKNLPSYTDAPSVIIAAFETLYDEIVAKDLTIRRVYVVAAHVLSRSAAKRKEAEGRQYEQIDLFSTAPANTGEEEEYKRPASQQEKEERLTDAILTIREKYGKNAILKGTSFLEGAMTRERNRQVGGHKA